VKDRLIGATSILFGVALIALAACGQSEKTEPDLERRANGASGRIAEAGGGSNEAAQASGKTRTRVDPRRGGFDISLGEWAVTPEARTIRPGRVTFVITNRGTMNHGFEIEADSDHSGSGGGDGFKFETELLAPGESTRVPVALGPGTYKIECLVDGHDDMGMEGFLEVRAGAPLVTRVAPTSQGSRVAIENFSFDPQTIELEVGAQVTWVNNDPAEHTVTGDDPALHSDTLASGDAFSARINEPGTYTYQCSIHPEMTARIQVSE
jgi:plastocyanin